MIYIVIYLICLTCDTLCSILCFLIRCCAVHPLLFIGYYTYDMRSKYPTQLAMMCFVKSSITADVFFEKNNRIIHQQPLVYLFIFGQWPKQGAPCWHMAKARCRVETSTTEAEYSHMIGRNRTAPSAGHLFGWYTLQRPPSSQVHLVWPPLHLVLATASEAVRSTDPRT